MAILGQYCVPSFIRKMSILFILLDNDMHCLFNTTLLCVLQLLFSLQHYEGDDRIKMFIFDLVSSSANGQEKDYRNHTGSLCHFLFGLLLNLLRHITGRRK